MSTQQQAQLGATPCRDLTQTRIELHWLAQVVAAAGDAFLEPAPDDGQSNMAWDPQHSALVGRPAPNGSQLGLTVADAELVVMGPDKTVVAQCQARGKRLKTLLSWAGDAMSSASGQSPRGELQTRGYPMASHQVSSGQPFAFENAKALNELARWFGNAAVWVTEASGLDPRASDVRCWPHHFDVGAIIMLEPDKPFEEASQLGLGWSPGDDTYAEPYFYVTPFPVPDRLPDLPSGHWHREGFTGAILTGTQVVAAGDSGAQSRSVRDFLRETIEQLLPQLPQTATPSE